MGSLGVAGYSQEVEDSFLITHLSSRPRRSKAMTVEPDVLQSSSSSNPLIPFPRGQELMRIWQVNPEFLPAPPPTSQHSL